MMELYDRTIVLKRIPGIPGKSLESCGTSRALLGTPLGPPVDAPGTPGDPHRPQKRQYLSTFAAPEAVDCCIRILLLQRIAPNDSS